MRNLSQSELQRQVEILVGNGQLAQAQAVIARVGYNAAALEAGAATLQTWLGRRSTTQAMLAAQKRATQAEQAARQAAQAEVSRFSQTVRILFGQDEMVLTTLGLTPRRENGHSNGAEAGDSQNGSGNGNGQAKNRTSHSAAATIARWRLLLANAQALSQEQRSRLAGAGWDEARLAAAQELIEAYAAADTGHKQSAQAYQVASAAAQEVEAELREWYRQATRLVKLAIKQADPANQTRLEELLGL